MRRKSRRKPLRSHRIAMEIAPFHDRRHWLSNGQKKAPNVLNQNNSISKLRPRYPVTSSASRPVSVRPYSSTASTTTR